MRFRVVGPDGERLPIGGERLVEVPESLAHPSHRVVRVGGVGIERQCGLQRVRGLLVLPALHQRRAEVAAGRRVPRIKGDGAAERLEGLVEAAGPLQRHAQVIGRHRRLRRDPHRGLEGLQALRMVAERREHDPEVQPRLGRLRVAGHRLTIGPECLIGPAQLPQRVAQVAPGDRAAGPQRQRLPVGGQRLIGAAQAAEDVPAVGVGGGEPRIPRQRTVEVFEGLHRPARPLRHHPGQVQHLGEFGCQLQRLLQQEFRVPDPAREVVLVGALQQGGDLVERGPRAAGGGRRRHGTEREHGRALRVGHGSTGWVVNSTL